MKENTSREARKELVQIYLQGKSGDWQKGDKQGTVVLIVFVEIGRIILLILAIMRWKSKDLPTYLSQENGRCSVLIIFASIWENCTKRNLCRLRNQHALTRSRYLHVCDWLLHAAMIF